MSLWFRWYKGTCEDGKFRVIARNAGVTVVTVIGVWAIMLEDASHSEHRGVVTRDEDFFGAILDVDITVIHKIMCEMDRLGMVQMHSDSTTITNWKTRQFETDAKDPTNADRQRRWRANNPKKKGHAAKTHRNGLRNGLQNVRVTVAKRPDTDTEKIYSSSGDDGFDAFYDAYPRHVGKKAARKAFEKAIRETSLDKILNALDRQKPLWNEPKFIPHPATWLNRGQWDDEPALFKPKHLEGIL